MVSFAILSHGLQPLYHIVFGNLKCYTQKEENKIARIKSVLDAIDVFVIHKNALR